MKLINKRPGFLLVVLSLIFSLGVDAQDLKHLRSFMQAAPTPPDAIPYGNNPKAGHYLNTGDARIYYEVYGKGKPFVILHGGVFGSTYEMGRFIDSLSKNYQVIAISTRGHGKSEMGSTAPTYEQKANDVNAILNTVTKDSAIVLGFSDGGYTGYYLAGLYPNKVKKLITIGAGEWLKGSRSFNITRKDAFGLDSLYWKQQMALNPHPEKFEEWLVSINQYYNTVNISKEVFGKVHCPVLLMAGELDQNAALKTVIGAYYMFPKVQLAIIPNAPHPAFQVNFPAVWAAIVPFLQQ
ncbi:alpha/beta hydrolase [Mucilaginibacter rubeus]|uniref:Alpha/beta hydrolase n=1 Tax=Mucilaginibacter rubeus TaxID=2027860 RepID=A0AAE6JGB2_9SPHI|nr:MULTISPECIES: alpha/beta hydrolase [Mucilaginibacter]QEM05035.1 alpha/beta hydrolase [Mucilaginibacter rubeus]QEM17630.1 alpha/beta hydrolase [Mucilaginibacter gossypii]QTE45850.1 alpha/beta hydrolase [Mucilaginibacter rubeus]QTE52447.1 alpha/beta hydrolase [Mucilaginibacter rubeus]QTE57535.1 alpha/beta hydrolase [Mucilaginibacter rubeus]